MQPVACTGEWSRLTVTITLALLLLPPHCHASCKVQGLGHGQLLEDSCHLKFSLVNESVNRQTLKAVAILSVLTAAQRAVSSVFIGSSGLPSATG